MQLMQLWLENISNCHRLTPDPLQCSCQRSPWTTPARVLGKNEAVHTPARPCRAQEGKERLKRRLRLPDSLRTAASPLVPTQHACARCAVRTRVTHILSTHPHLRTTHPSHWQYLAVLLEHCVESEEPPHVGWPLLMLHLQV